MAFNYYINCIIKIKMIQYDLRKIIYFYIFYFSKLYLNAYIYHNEMLYFAHLSRYLSNKLLCAYNLFPIFIVKELSL